MTLPTWVFDADRPEAIEAQREMARELQRYTVPRFTVRDLKIIWVASFLKVAPEEAEMIVDVGRPGEALRHPLSAYLDVAGDA